MWVVEEKLACAQRPLRRHPVFGGREPFPPEATAALVRWVDHITAMGFASIICQSHEKELEYYKPLQLHSDGLLGLYRAVGLHVEHFPWPDPAHAATPVERERRMVLADRIKVDASDAFERMPKPVLLHCSSGIDRSPPVAAFIAAKYRSHRGT
jgi:protein tyrosine phosphatase (PTP) superfamily phosphohydrolase (DUF442 family)